VTIQLQLTTTTIIIIIIIIIIIYVRFFGFSENTGFGKKMLKLNFPLNFQRALYGSESQLAILDTTLFFCYTLLNRIFQFYNKGG
jgi:hypothetical protein